MYRLPHDEHLSMLSLGRAVRVLAIATTVDEANEAMAADPVLSCLYSKGPLILLADENDLGQLPGPKSVERTAGVLVRMLQRPTRGADWTLPAEATAAVDALREALGIIPEPPPLFSPENACRALLQVFDARFGDAVAGDTEIDGCDAVDWISEFAPRVRATLNGAA